MDDFFQIWEEEPLEEGKGNGARARNTDPVSSHIAAAMVDFESLEMKVINSLRSYGPQTTSELERNLKKLAGSITPRMVPLEEKGKVIRMKDNKGYVIHRKSLHSNSPQIVWTLRELLI